MNVSILAVALAASTSGLAAVEVTFSPRGGAKAETLAAIGAATTSIDIAMYSFSESGLQQAVVNASANGVKVRLILDGANEHADVAGRLEAAGVDVRYVTPVMHHKFAIFDGPQAEGDIPSAATLLTGSGNWSSSSYNNFDEDFLKVTEEHELVVAFQNEFNHLWENSREFGDALLGATTAWEAVEAPVVFTSSNMLAYQRAGQPAFKPLVAAEEGVAGAAIVAAIDGAETSIQIATTHFRRADFQAALGRALERGVTVDILLDGQEFHGKPTGDQGYDESLAEAGATVRYKMYSRFWDYRTAKQMHSKYMIVDGVTVLTGSFNWSNNAELKTMENLLTLDASVAPLYSENFATIFAYGAGSLIDLVATVKASGGQGPCTFEPIALTVEEVRLLRSAYAKDACE